MVDLIAYPFRLDAGGKVATTEDGENYYAQELACLVQTKPGERILVPDYGMNDLTFHPFSKAELVEKIGMFGPPVTITKCENNVISDSLSRVTLEYNPVTINTETEGDYEGFTAYDNSDEFFDDGDIGQSVDAPYNAD